MGERISFNLSNFAQQEFPFSLKLIQFINNEADAEVKQMLDRSCKYFFKELPYLIIDSLEISQGIQRIENEKYDGCMVFMDDDELDMFLEKVKFIWITKKIEVSAGHYLDGALAAKIVRCDASEISVLDCRINLKGLKYLTKSGNVEYLDMSNSFSIFTDLDTSPVPLEDVLSLVPTARVIKMSNCHITRQTMKKLLAIPWKNKITELSLTNVDRSLNANWFFTFVKKHLDPEAEIQVNFNFENDAFKEQYHRRVLKYDEKMPMFEMDAPAAKMFPPPEDESKSYQKKITFNDHDAERQYFAFPYPHMCYIRENADAETWKKFERTCKFFYPRNRYFMVDNLHIGTDKKITIMTDNKKMVFENNYELSKPYWLTNSLHVLRKIALSQDDRIEATEIFISSLRISMRIFKFLTKSGMVKDWNSVDSFVINIDSKGISLTELMVHLPNAEYISAKVCGIHPRNGIQPPILPQRNNIDFLRVRFCKDPIIASSLLDILTKTLAPKARVLLNLGKLTNKMDVPQFKAELKEKLDTWKPQIERPIVKIIF